MQGLSESEEIGTATKGKQAELIVIGKLLERGYKVYTPLIDTGIDCLVDVGGGNYKEIQIKYREDQPSFTARKFKARDNFYFICCLSTRRGDDFWILPSKVFDEVGTSTAAKNREYTQLRIGGEGSDTYNQLIKYHDNFGVLLAGATKEIRKVVQQASKRIAGPHLKLTDYEAEVIAVLSKEPNPLERKEIVGKVYERLHERFSEADKEMSRKTGMARWEKTVRWAVTELKNKGMILSVGKNRWVITSAGRESWRTFFSKGWGIPPKGKGLN